MSGVMKEDRIGKKYVRSSIGVAKVVSKVRENRLTVLGM